MQEPTRRRFLAAVSAAAIPTGKWREHGLAESKRDRLRKFLAGAAASQAPAGGALLLIHDGEVIFREGFGYRDVESREPFSTEGICHLASLTKPIVSTLLVILEDRGVFSLDDPVKKYLPEFASAKVSGGPLNRDLLLWHCPSHRTGFPGNAENPDSAREFMDWSVGDYVRKKLSDGLVAQPGERYAYSRLGFMTAQLVVEQATGRGFEDVIRETLFEPVAMSRTTFRPSPKVLSENPTRYGRQDGKLVKQERMASDAGAQQLINAGGGLFSTLDEVAGFIGLHLARGVVNGERLVSADALARMRRPHPPDRGEGIRYGLGWNLQTGRIAQARHLGASGAMGFVDVEAGWGGVLLTQTRWQGNQAFRREFEDQINSIFRS